MDDDDELRIGGKLVVTETTGCCGYYCLGVMVFWQSVLITPVDCLILFVLAFYQLGHTDAMIVYGNLPAISGVMIVFTFLILLLSIPTGIYVSKTGNRVIAIALMSQMGLAMLLQMSNGFGILAAVAPKYDTEFQLHCLEQKVENRDEDACRKYFADDTRGRLYDYWLHKAQQSDKDPAVRSVMISRQKVGSYGGPCCGFGRPQHCNVNRTLVPPSKKWFDTKWASREQNKASSCGGYRPAQNVFQPNERWYPPTKRCNMQPASKGGLLFGEGCAFDIPIGDSCTGGADMLGFVTNAEAGGSRKGCAYKVQAYLRGEQTTVANILFGLLYTQFLLILTTLLYFLKRKYRDKIPVHGWQLKEDLADDLLAGIN